MRRPSPSTEGGTPPDVTDGGTAEVRTPPGPPPPDETVVVERNPLNKARRLTTNAPPEGGGLSRRSCSVAFLNNQAAPVGSPAPNLIDDQGHRESTIAPDAVGTSAKEEPMANIGNRPPPAGDHWDPEPGTSTIKSTPESVHDPDLQRSR